MFRVRTPEDLDRIPFRNGMALVEVPIDLLDAIDLKNHHRAGAAQVRKVARSIRIRGFSSVEPIKVRIGRRGRWVVLDGGHRLTAARQVHKEFWTNLFRRKVSNLHFLVLTGPASWVRSGLPDGIDPDDLIDHRGDGSGG